MPPNVRGFYCVFKLLAVAVIPGREAAAANLNQAVSIRGGRLQKR
jgi:hypothetical protein